MSATLEAFLAGSPQYLIYWATAMALLGLSGLIYVLISPVREIRLIREGNTAAALTLAAVILALAMPISAALANSLSVLDLTLWSLFALSIQLLILRLVDLLLPDLSKRIESGDMAAALTLSGIKLAAGLITAAGLSDPHL